LHSDQFGSCNMHSKLRLRWKKNLVPSLPEVKFQWISVSANDEIYILRCEPSEFDLDLDLFGFFFKAKDFLS